jgi:hypothetical protein
MNVRPGAITNILKTNTLLTDIPVKEISWKPESFKIMFCDFDEHNNGSRRPIRYEAFSKLNFQRV